MDRATEVGWHVRRRVPHGARSGAGTRDGRDGGRGCALRDDVVVVPLVTLGTKILMEHLAVTLFVERLVGREANRGTTRWAN